MKTHKDIIEDYKQLGDINMARIAAELPPLKVKERTCLGCKKTFRTIYNEVFHCPVCHSRVTSTSDQGW